MRHSAKPVAYTHCCPTGIMEHPRNKTDAEMRAVAERGGFIGVATYPPFLPWGDETTVDQCVEVFEYVIDVAGEDAVGIGTDFTQDQDVSFFEWLRRDKGHGRLLVPGTPRVPRLPEGLATIEEFSEPDRRDGPPGVERDPDPQGPRGELATLPHGGMGRVRRVGSVRVLPRLRHPALKRASAMVMRSSRSRSGRGR